MIVKESVLEKVLDEGLSQGADFAEVYLENTYENTMEHSNQRLTESLVGRMFGAGIRLFYDKKVIYTYTNDLSEKGLLDAARKAASAMSGASSLTSPKLSLKSYDSIHNYNKGPWDLSKEKKIDYLKQIDREGRSYHSDITQVISTLKEVHKQVQIANSRGLLSTETRQYSGILSMTVAERNGEKERGFDRVAKLSSSDFFETLDYKSISHRAASLAINNLDAQYAPAGEMPVVIDNGFGGVIFHEACGHGLETTSVAKGASVFCNKLNERLANECVTAIDDGTIANEYGSLMIDDEGYPTQKTTLIEKGLLKSYIVDQMGSLKTGYKPTGSGRRQNYRFAPASRMRNTFIAPGDTPLEKMISDIDYGLYAKRMGGGSVTPGTGAYNFSVMESFLIKNGKIDQRVKGASLIGTGIETLGRISKVGNNFELAPGTCGSVSGMIPTTVGQPAILVSKLTVGGRA